MGLIRNQYEKLLISCIVLCNKYVCIVISEGAPLFTPYCYTDVIFSSRYHSFWIV